MPANPDYQKNLDYSRQWLKLHGRNEGLLEIALNSDQQLIWFYFRPKLRAITAYPVKLHQPQDKFVAMLERVLTHYLTMEERESYA